MRWLDLIFAARPLLHLPVWSIYLVSLHYHQAATGRRFQWEDLAVMAGLSLLSAGAYYLNQVYDRAGDAINRKLGFVEEGWLSERELMAAYVALSGIALTGAALLSWALLVLFGQLFVIGYMYSAPPFRLKDRAVWGLWANAWSFGLVVPLAVMRDYHEQLAGLSERELPWFFLAAVGAIYLLTTIPDREGDRVTGKRTLGVIWPVWVVKVTAVGMMGLAGVIAFTGELAGLVVVALISLAPIIVSLLAPVPPVERMAAKVPVVVLALWAGRLFPIYLVFVVVLVVATRIYYRMRFNQVYPQLN